MSSTRKTASVLLACLMLIGGMAVSAMATPDEWIPEAGPYLVPSDQYNTAETARAEDAAAAGSYLVQKGDTLLSISGRLGVAVSELVAVNNLKDPDLVREGQALLIPGGVQVHTVQPGETLSAIAVKFGVDPGDIAAANNISNQDMLLAGSKLVICTGSGVSAGETAASVSRALPIGQLEWPVVGRISSAYGIRDGKPHEGIDIAAGYGAPIKAAMEGRVVFAGPRGTYGLTVILDHGDGLRTLYAHSSEILVSEGERVTRGQVIALVGNTGKSTGPHLHMEMLINGTPYDPMLCIRRSYA